jgi:hypothetical protein
LFDSGQAVTINASPCDFIWHLGHIVHPTLLLQTFFFKVMKSKVYGMWPAALEDLKANPLGSRKCSLGDVAMSNKELCYIYDIAACVMEPILWMFSRNKSNGEKQVS